MIEERFSINLIKYDNIDMIKAFAELLKILENCAKLYAY